MGDSSQPVWPELAAVLDDIASLKLNLDDRLSLQTCWTDLEKGWRVSVERRHTHNAGLGLFAQEKLVKAQILRRHMLGKDLVQFQSKEDRCTFMNRFPSDSQESVCTYIADYTFGLKCGEEGGVFYGLFFPGCGPNHFPQGNSCLQFHYSSDGQIVGIDHVALNEIGSGEEITGDYRPLGEAPTWLVNWHGEYCPKLELTFPGTNHYVS